MKQGEAMNKPTPFVEHCLKDCPIVSAATVQMMRLAWDRAIETALRECREASRGRPHGGSNVGQIVKRLEALKTR